MDRARVGRPPGRTEMTAGYDPSDPAVRQPPPPPPDTTGAQGPRPGPHPPRMQPADPLHQPTGQVSGWAAGQVPAQPISGFGPGPGSSVVPAYGPGAPVSAPAGCAEGPPTSAFPVPAVIPPPSRPPRGGRLGTIAFVLVLLLLAVVGVQAFLLASLNDRLAAAQRDATAARADTDSRLRGMESRTGELEKKGIDPQAVAKEVLPSVFRVNTGKSIGTAFAIGRP